MPNAQKIARVEEVAQDLSQAKSAALIQYQGLSADDIARLRDQVKQTGGRLEVVKNSLISRALEKIGISLPQPLTGPTAIAYCQTDEIAPLKEIDKVNKDKEKTSFKYGVYNRQLLALDQLKQFLSLPSKTNLLAQFVGGLANPLIRLVYSLRYNQTRLVLALKAISQK